MLNYPMGFCFSNILQKLFYPVMVIHQFFKKAAG